MRRRMMKSKIHRATVTDANLHYVGSITVDRDLMDAADLLEYEQVAVVDIDNGARLETYVIEGAPAAATSASTGPPPGSCRPATRSSSSATPTTRTPSWTATRPTVVHVDTANEIVDEHTAAALAALDQPAPRRYVPVEAAARN